MSEDDIKLIKEIKIENSDIRGFENFGDNKILLGNSLGYIFTINKKLEVKKKFENKNSDSIRIIKKIGEDLFAFGYDDGNILTMKSNGKVKKFFQAHSKCARQILPLDDIIITASYDRTIKFWKKKFKGEKCEKEISNSHNNDITSLILVKDDRIATGCYDGIIKIWDMNGKEKLKIAAHKGWVICLIRLKNDKILSSGADHKIKMWSKKGKMKVEFNGHNDYVRDIVQLEDERIVSCSDDKNVIIWNKKGDKLQEFKLSCILLHLLVLENKYSFICFGKLII
jgi:WD40 repeat protein